MKGLVVLWAVAIKVWKHILPKFFCMKLCRRIIYYVHAMRMVRDIAVALFMLHRSQIVTCFLPAIRLYTTYRAQS